MSSLLLVFAQIVVTSFLQVDLTMGPPTQGAAVDDIITVALVASAASPESITAIDAIISWDPSRLALLGATVGPLFPVFVSGFLPDPDGINLDLTDGDALFTVLAPPGSSASVPPSLVVVTFEFKVMTSAYVSLLPELGAFGKTRVFGLLPGLEITGVLSEPVSVEVPGAWTDLGSGLAGTGGLTPVLTGDGLLLDCDPISFSLTDALPDTTAYFVVGLVNISLPFKGGTFVPSPDFIITLPTGPLGELTLASTWLSGVPPGFSLYYQCWIDDGGGAVGFAASNGLQGTTP